METQEPVANPAGEALRVEMADIMGNPQNPLHAGYRRNEPSVMKQIEEKYARVYGTQPVTIGSSGLSSETKPSGSAQSKPVTAQEGEIPEDAEVRARTELILSPLRSEWGEEFDRRFADARTGARTLFTGLEDALEELGTRVRMEFGPKGETAALRFLAELERIKAGG